MHHPPILERLQAYAIPDFTPNLIKFLAKKKDGNWIIVELGDGQVAGLPDNANKDEFYKELKK